MKIEIGIPTRDRYPNLAMLLWSLCEQAYTNWVVTIVDDSEDRRDIRELDYMLPILRRLDQEGHSWRVEFGERKGPHYCHQLVLERARSPYIWRVDDDCICDRDCLSKLVKVCTTSSVQIGAVGPIVVDPSSLPLVHRTLPEGFQSFKKYQGKIDEYGVTYGDHQWALHPDKNLQEVEHLYSSFLYSKEAANKIGGYDLEFELPGHREETDFSYRLFKEGYKLFVQPEALVWHLRNPKGGIRSFNDANLWAECHEHFIDKFGFKRGRNQDKVIKIFGGLGDHLCATPLLRGLKKTGGKLVVSSIYPYLFAGNPYIDELIFPPDEKEYKKVDERKVYKWGFENKFEGKLSQAWCKAYDIKWDSDELDYTIFPGEREWVRATLGTKESFIIIAPYGATPTIQFFTETKSSKKMTVIRDWFKECWEEVVDEIKNLGIKVFQVGGQGEEPIKGCDKYFIGLDYRKVIALLEQSSGFITVDSFLQHAGHAIKKRGVVLFGPSNPQVTGHDSNINLKTNECDLKFSCIPYGNSRDQWSYKNSNCKSRLCMRSITVDMVMKGLEKLLEEKDETTT